MLNMVTITGLHHSMAQALLWLLVPFRLKTRVLTITYDISSDPCYHVVMTTKPERHSRHSDLLTAELSICSYLKAFANVMPLPQCLHLLSDVTFLVRHSLVTQSKIVTPSCALPIPSAYFILLVVLNTI